MSTPSRLSPRSSTVENDQSSYSHNDSVSSSPSSSSENQNQTITTSQSKSTVVEPQIRLYAPGEWEKTSALPLDMTAYFKSPFELNEDNLDFTGEDLSSMYSSTKPDKSMSDDASPRSANASSSQWSVALPRKVISTSEPRYKLLSGPSTNSTSSHTANASSTSVATSSSTSSSSSSFSTTTSTTAVKPPPPGTIMKPTALAKLLVQAERTAKVKVIKENGKEEYELKDMPLTGSKVTDMLRGKATLEDVNIIDTYLNPFMEKYFNTPNVNSILNSVQKGFEDNHDEAAELYTSLGGGKNFAPKDDKAAALMNPIIAPIVEFICGKNNSIESSGLPLPVLELLLAVDEEVVKWFNENGSGNLQELQLARENALISFFGTRSFMGKWTINLNSDQSKGQRYYQPLTGYVNSYLNLQVKTFAQNLMNSTPEQKATISKRSAIFNSRTQSRMSMTVKPEKTEEPKEKKEDSKLHRLFQRGATLNEKKSEPTSPRGKKETEVVHSPRRQLQRETTNLRDNDSRQTTLIKNRTAHFKKIFEQNGVAQGGCRIP